MKEHTPVATLHCYWSDLSKHPKCIHGPSLLFGREVNGEISKFYTCSACRDRKICSFYAEHGQEMGKNYEENLKQKKRKDLHSYNHQKLFIFFNQLLGNGTQQRVYCHTCEKLLIITEKEKHNDHEITENLSDYQMTHPSELLKPLENSKKEAQYLFSKKAVKDITDLLINLNAENVLCIGAPRIHEYITNNLEGKMSSLLLDFDGRFHNFFGPLNYCWYNLFNHHFFLQNSKNVFEEFLKQNGGKNLFLVCDPPFGGRVEPISQTFKSISELHKKLNNINNEEDELKIFFIFPYFMEAIIREKSNPPNICGGLKELKMTDYKVEYDNHPLFVPKANNEKLGSQVRLFTNVPLNLIKLPEEDGYKYCKRCDRWVSSENKHCKICHSCTSKDGRRYKHCKLCERCVKPTWMHCKKCNRCSLPTHKCGQKPNIGTCFKCKQPGHTEKECVMENSNNPGELLKIKKRKNSDEPQSLPKKKIKAEQIEMCNEEIEESKLKNKEKKKLFSLEKSIEEKDTLKISKKKKNKSFIKKNVKNKMNKKKTELTKNKNSKINSTGFSIHNSDSVKENTKDIRIVKKKKHTKKIMKSC